MSDLQIREVRKAFAGQPVLREVSLDAAAARCSGLLGPNGAGKSTLFKIVMGLVRADAGSVTLGGRDVLAAPLHGKIELGIGYLPQDSASFPELSARDNILALLELLKLDRRRRLRRAAWLLRTLGIHSFQRRAYGKLSGGERRRVEIAKALVGRPRILLLDEPFSGLDPAIMADLAGLIRRLVGEGLGVLLTDHNVHVTLHVVDYATVLVDGVVLRQGTPEQLREDPAVRTAYLGALP